MPEFLRDYALGMELFQMVRSKNGFYAFESALHVFPVTPDPVSGLEGWNADSLWRSDYQDLTEGLLFFAEDILQDQFCLSRNEKNVLRFYAETGETVLFADSVKNGPTPSCPITKWNQVRRWLTNSRLKTVPWFQEKG
jgi:hypothetical protein